MPPVFTGGFPVPPNLPPVRPARYRIPGLGRGRPLLVGPGVALPASTFPPAPGYVRLTTVEGPLLSLDLFTTGEPYLLSEGFAAGWETTKRAGRVELPKWTGGALIRQAIPATMDVLKVPGVDIEDEWRALKHLARPVGGARPPALRLAGPVDYKDLDWTIVGLDIDSDSTRRRGHRMVRQRVTITVQQWTDPKVRTVLATTTPEKDRPVVVHSTAGRNTLKKIAKHYLGHAKEWKVLARLNRGLGDPDRKLPPGTQVLLPPGTKIAAGANHNGPGGFRAP